MKRIARIATRGLIVLIGTQSIEIARAQLPSQIDLSTLGPLGITISGASANSKLGAALADGFDIDGDGRCDLAIAGWQDDPLGRIDAGSVEVVLHPDPAFSALDLAAPASNVVRVAGAKAGDACGVALASGFDFNGDGYLDLAIGAFRADPLGRVDAGVVYVVLGRTTFPSTIDLLANPNGVIEILGAAPNDGLGVAIASAGDVDHDGMGDLLLGAPFSSPLGRGSAGTAYLLRGRASSLATHDVVDLAQGGGPLAPRMFLGALPGDRLGNSLAGGLTRGGQSAIALGAPFADPAGRLDAGAIYVVNASGPLVIDLATPPPALLKIEGASAGDQLATSLANGSNASDLDADGANDLLAGSFRASSASSNGCGRVDAISVATLATSIDLLQSGSSIATIFGSSASSQLGYATSFAADIDGNGTSDFVMGMRGFDGASGVDAGAAVVVMRSASSPAIVDLSAPLGVHVATATGAQAFDRAGYAIAEGGDLDGDGFLDILIGAINAAPSFSTTVSPGAVYALFSNTTDLSFVPSVVGSAAAGGTLDLTWKGTPGASAFALLSSQVHFPPIPIWPHRYGLALDPAALVVVGPFPLGASDGALGFALPFPPVPALLGASFALQAFASLGGAGDFSKAYAFVLP